eukprot:756073-Hanusia_phi.AAC.2
MPPLLAAADWLVLQERKSAAAQMLQHAWRAYQSQLAKKHQKGNKHAYESGVGENNILYEPVRERSGREGAEEAEVVAVVAEEDRRRS